MQTKLHDTSLSLQLNALAVQVPQTELLDSPSFHRALRSPERDLWVAAIRKEMGTLTSRNVFRFLDDREHLPREKIAFPVHFVLKKKYSQFGEVDKFKARCELNGSRQRADIDYFCSYAPVVDFGSLCILVSFAHARKWNLWQYVTGWPGLVDRARPERVGSVGIGTGRTGSDRRSAGD